ncbi:MAG: hypothetical protein K2X37_14370 [Chitinophagaceae bacterium]|nr:hypothetical protein [Chitinophagaceae bacterium]
MRISRDPQLDSNSLHNKQSSLLVKIGKNSLGEAVEVDISTYPFLLVTTDERGLSTRFIDECCINVFNQSKGSIIYRSTRQSKVKYRVDESFAIRYFFEDDPSISSYSSKMHFIDSVLRLVKSDTSNTPCFLIIDDIRTFLGNKQSTLLLAIIKIILQSHSHHFHVILGSALPYANLFNQINFKHKAFANILVYNNITLPQYLKQLAGELVFTTEGLIFLKTPGSLGFEKFYPYH